MPIVYVVFSPVRMPLLKSKLSATYEQNLVLSSFGKVSSAKSSDLVTAADLSNFITSVYEAQKPSDGKTSNSTFDHVVW